MHPRRFRSRRQRQPQRGQRLARELAALTGRPIPRNNNMSVPRDVIRRVGSNDPFTVELGVGSYINNKETAEEVADALRGNTHLKKVSFREYKYNEESLEVILAALAGTRVVKISVGPQSHILRYEGAYAMAVVRHLPSLQSLTRLDLNGCSIGGPGATILSTILADNSTLRRLDLVENEIGDEGAVALGQALGRNRTLTEMILDTNDIGDYGQRALRNAIFDDSSFEAMVNSNHVLQSYFYNPRNVFGKLVLNDVLSSHAANMRSTSPAGAATKKLKRMLKKKYRVELHFETFVACETAVMPHLLGWISDRCDLDMMYQFWPILLNLLEGRAGATP